MNDIQKKEKNPFVELLTILAIIAIVMAAGAAFFKLTGSVM